jgi:hypothetical protein
MGKLKLTEEEFAERIKEVFNVYNQERTTGKHSLSNEMIYVLQNETDDQYGMIAKYFEILFNDYYKYFDVKQCGQGNIVIDSVKSLYHCLTLDNSEKMSYEYYKLKLGGLWHLV